MTHVEGSGWNEPESDSWGPEVTHQTGSNQRNRTGSNKEGWNETREWDEAEGMTSSDDS